MLFLHFSSLYYGIIYKKGMNYMMNEEISKESYSKDEEVNVMPTIEMIECERVAYVKEMEEYLQQLKQMNKCDAKRKSFENLVKSQIIHEDGEFTERYEYTKIIMQKKR